METTYLLTYLWIHRVFLLTFAAMQWWSEKSAKRCKPCHHAVPIWRSAWQSRIAILMTSTFATTTNSAWMNAALPTESSLSTHSNEIGFGYAIHHVHHNFAHIFCPNLHYRLCFMFWRWFGSFWEIAHVYWIACVVLSEVEGAQLKTSSQLN